MRLIPENVSKSTSIIISRRVSMIFVPSPIKLVVLDSYSIIRLKKCGPQFEKFGRTSYPNGLM